jgi:hypothetical protein
MRKDGSTPAERVSIVVPLALGIFLLGDGLFGFGTLDHAGALHRAIPEAIGVVLIVFSMYRLVKFSRKSRTGL